MNLYPKGEEAKSSNRRRNWCYYKLGRGRFWSYQQGKQIVWLDDTNFDLFCRRKRERARAGNRAVHKLPASKGPNVNLICAISAAGLLAVEWRRGSFNNESATAWVETLIQRTQDTWNRLEDLVIVVDNAPAIAGLKQFLIGQQLHYCGWLLIHPCWIPWKNMVQSEGIRKDKPESPRSSTSWCWSCSFCSLYIGPVLPFYLWALIISLKINVDKFK